MLQITTVLKIRLSSKVIGSKVELCKIKISISDFWTFPTLQVNSDKYEFLEIGQFVWPVSHHDSDHGHSPPGNTGSYCIILDDVESKALASNYAGSYVESGALASNRGLMLNQRHWPPGGGLGAVAPGRSDADGASTIFLSGQTPIPLRTGIKYPVRGIPHFDQAPA